MHMREQCRRNMIKLFTRVMNLPYYEAKSGLLKKFSR